MLFKKLPHEREANIYYIGFTYAHEHFINI